MGGHPEQLEARREAPASLEGRQGLSENNLGLKPTRSGAFTALRCRYPALGQQEEPGSLAGFGTGNSDIFCDRIFG
jgi:hypothetical protein